MTSAKVIEKNESSPFVLDKTSTNKPVKLLNLKKFLFTGWFPLIFKIFAAIFILFYSLYALKAVQKDTQLTMSYLTEPKVGDVYFLDYRLMAREVRPTQRFRLAKLVDITGDILTLEYGSLYYMNHNAIEQAIHYGQLRYNQYFESKRYDFKQQKIISMYEQGAIYMVQRPKHNKLYGNYVSADIHQQVNQLYIPGKTENNKGEEFLKAKGIENSDELAFANFNVSAELNYPKGQVNLAEMYINGTFVEKNLDSALYWLMQASLQSHKPAILKYVIICQQVKHCNEIAFYEALQDSGVSIKVRALSKPITLN